MARRAKRVTAKRGGKRKRHSRRLRSARSYRTRLVAPRVALNLISFNQQDNLIVELLANAEFGNLPVDRIAEVIWKQETGLQDRVARLRKELVEVYREAAKRQSEKASWSQINSAEITLRSLTAALERLDRIKPARHRGLQAIFGSSPDDHKGADELNEFAANCWQVKLELANVAQKLARAIELEKAKPSKSGDRKRRLRTLVEALANWWTAKIRKPMAPYVYAKRGEGEPAFVVGRQGDFIELATSLFSRIDDFKESEVISAVTNVHESRLRAKR
jgi:hypothetical protein